MGLDSLFNFNGGDDAEVGAGVAKALSHLFLHIHVIPTQIEAYLILLRAGLDWTLMATSALLPKNALIADSVVRRGFPVALFWLESTALARWFPYRRRCETAAKPAMELVLRFCDSRVCLSGKLRATVAAFLPAPLVVRARCPGGPEELPRLDRRFDQSLV